MRYPSKKKLAEKNKKLKNAESTHMVGPSSSPAEKFRWDLCQSIVRYMIENDLSQVELAKRLQIDQARISEIVRHRIDKVSTDKLIAYNEQIDPSLAFSAEGRFFGTLSRRRKAASMAKKAQRMRKITKFVLVAGVLVSSASWANAKPTHLEKLKFRYPYGLIGGDYGLLTEEDLAVNTCVTTVITPFAGEKNMAYPYWQCFPVKDTKMECDSTGYDSVEKKETGHMVFDALGGGGLQSYIVRDAMDMRECRKWLRLWKKKTRGEKHVCLSGSYAAYSEIRDGQQVTGWVFDKFKTRKGCEARGITCSLKDLSSLEGCLLPSHWSRK